MALALIEALLDTIEPSEFVSEEFRVDAVRQTDDPRACLRQTWLFIQNERRRTGAGPPLDNPNIAWMQARCGACGVCRIGA